MWEEVEELKVGDIIRFKNDSLRPREDRLDGIENKYTILAVYDGVLGYIYKKDNPRHISGRDFETKGVVYTWCVYPYDVQRYNPSKTGPVSDDSSCRIHVSGGPQSLKVEIEDTTLEEDNKEKNRIRLQPANPKLKPFFVKEVVIQGKVISTFRNLEEQKKKEKKFKFNQFLCGDVLDMIKKIPDSSIHFAVTSPPYNVGKDYDNHNDKMNHQDYLDWLYKVWIETKRVLVPGGRFAINIAPTGIKDFVAIHHDYIEQMKKLGMKFRTEILWYKQTMLKRTAWGSFKSPANPHIVPSWEYVLIFTKDQDRLDGDPQMADITKEEFMKFSDGFWKIQPETQRKGHPAPFPEELIYRLVKFYSYKGNNILDMFGGTGTVATIATRTGRNFVHIDISPQYCKVASDRVEKEKLQNKLI